MGEMEKRGRQDEAGFSSKKDTKEPKPKHVGPTLV